MMRDNFTVIFNKNRTGGVRLKASAVDSETHRARDRYFNAILFAFIVAFLLIALLTGVKVYTSVNDARESSDTSRLGLSLIANNVRLNDTTGSVGVGSGPEGDALVLTEVLEQGTYETRIYRYEGKIVEEYSNADNAYTPAKAREIVASERFDFSYSDGLLTVNTDHGSVDVFLHSSGGAS